MIIGSHRESRIFPAGAGEGLGMLFLRFREFLEDMFIRAGGELDLIVFEQAHFRGGAATRLCVGLATCVLVFAAEKGIRTESVHTAELKKWATGKGNADKGAMIREAHRLGYRPRDDNEADALMLLEFTGRGVWVEEACS